MAMPPLPGHGIASRPLHLFFLCDTSGSMSVDGKIEALNTAIREAVPHIQAEAKANSTAQVFVNSLQFDDAVSWHVGSPAAQIRVEDFAWKDLAAKDGLTAMGKALSTVAGSLVHLKRGLPPVIILVTDGEATDDFKSGLRALMANPWGKAAVRVAIAIGEHDVNLATLQAFIGNPEIKPLVVHDVAQLAKAIKWASTVVVKSVVAPGSVVVAPPLGLAAGSAIAPVATPISSPVAAAPAPPALGTPTSTDDWDF